MNRKPFLQSLSEGRGNCPLPSRTHPQKLNLAVYTEDLTHLGNWEIQDCALVNCDVRAWLKLPSTPPNM